MHLFSHAEENQQKVIWQRSLCSEARITISLAINSNTLRKHSPDTGISGFVLPLGGRYLLLISWVRLRTNMRVRRDSSAALSSPSSTTSFEVPGCRDVRIGSSYTRRKAALDPAKKGTLVLGPSHSLWTTDAVHSSKFLTNRNTTKHPFIFQMLRFFLLPVPN